MHFEDRFTFYQIRHVHVDLAIESTCTHQGFVQNVSTVCSSQDDHPAVCAKTIHLREELVQGILTLII